MRKVLELPAFRRLLAVTILNELGVSVGAVALSLLVYRRTGSALGAAAFFLCAEFGPAFFSPLFVARLDQRSASSVLSLLYALQALIFLALMWLVSHFALAPILALALANGTLSVAAKVLGRAAWTSITSPVKLLREANAAVNSSLSVCYMLGPAVGGAIVAIGGTRAALLVNVGVFCAMTLTVLTAKGLPKAVAERSPAAGRLGAALSKVRDDPLLRRLLGLQIAAMLFFTLSIPVEVVLARHTLHTGPGGYGGLLAAWGAGAIIGSAIYARWRVGSTRTLVTLGTVLLGGGFVVMAIAPALNVAIAGAVIAGTGNGIQIVAMRTALQEAIPAQWLALMLSLSESVFQAVPGIGIALGGGIAAIAGPRVALGVAGAGSFLVAMSMWLKLAGTERPTNAAGAPAETPPEAEPTVAFWQA